MDGAKGHVVGLGPRPHDVELRKARVSLLTSVTSHPISSPHVRRRLCSLVVTRFRILCILYERERERAREGDGVDQQRHHGM